MVDISRLSPQSVRARTRIATFWPSSFCGGADAPIPLSTPCKATLEGAAFALVHVLKVMVQTVVELAEPTGKCAQTQGMKDACSNFGPWVVPLLATYRGLLRQMHGTGLNLPSFPDAIVKAIDEPEQLNLDPGDADGDGGDVDDQDDSDK